jgi:hypothetical protein
MEEDVKESVELKLTKRIVELGEDVIVSIPDAGKDDARMPKLADHTAKTRAMTVAMLGLLAMPLCGLIAGDENLWERLQSLIESQRAVKTQSTVLAVDTAGLLVRSKSSSPATKELFEQAAMEHLARLQHTFNSWSERNQDLMGSVSLKFTVDSSGNVVRVEPMNSHLSNSGFIKTVMDNVLEWKFSNAGSEAAEITVPLLFIPKGMDPDMIAQWERKVASGRSDDRRAQPFSVTTVPPAIGSDRVITAVNSAPPPVQEASKGVAIALPAAPISAAKTLSIATTRPALRPKAEAKILPIVVANRHLAIRADPRYSANTVREVEESTPLSILDKRGDWLKVRTAQGGVTGFIRKEYISPSNG